MKLLWGATGNGKWVCTAPNRVAKGYIKGLFNPAGAWASFATAKKGKQPSSLSPAITEVDYYCLSLSLSAGLQRLSCQQNSVWSLLQGCLPMATTISAPCWEHLQHYSSLYLTACLNSVWPFLNVQDVHLTKGGPHQRMFQQSILQTNYLGGDQREVYVLWHPVAYAWPPAWV